MITLIEQKLESCNPDKFANMCRLFLAYKYEIINSTGFVLGKEKSKKGTPDNFIPIKDFFIFNEITTTNKKGLVAKLKNDIEHCFKQKDVPIEKILKIILICNNKISTSIQEELTRFKNTFNSKVELEIIGIDALATLIFKNYPAIAKQLGITIDTGQILEINEFISLYEKSKFSTPLSNHFYNREQELKQGLALLHNNDILIISGQAGAGKSKFSLELVKKFRETNPSYRAKYVKANGILDIWEDLKIQFINGGNYIIVVDDANKLKSNLDLIINFRNGFKNGKIILILTVRSYVKKEIQGKLIDYKSIDLKNFEKKELEKIMQSSDFNINAFYSNKIYSISKGNPRIAIMAALAGINGEFEKLKNASLILEEYFSSVNQQLNANKDLIKTAGILSLFRTIDLNHDKLMKEIETYFKISKNTLIENLEILFKYEIADEFNGSYKISDQILGEYLFYTVFIKQKQISFRLLLDLYLDENKFSLTKLLNPIVSNYGFEEIKLLIINDIKNKWNSLNDEDKCLKFLKDFWFYLPTETLMFINGLLEDSSIETNDFSFEEFKSNHIEYYEDQVIELLIKFQQFEDKFILALELLLKYSLSNQYLFSKLLKVLTQSFTYGKYDYNLKYTTQVKLFDYFYEKAKGLDCVFYSKIILFIAPKYLVDSYLSNYSDGNKMYLRQIPVYLTEEHKKFRKRLWNFIFTCYENDSLKEFVLDFFNRHRYENNFLDVNEVILFDKEFILEFFKNNFLPYPNYREAKVVNNYLQVLKRSKIPYDNSLEQRFANNELSIFYLLDELGGNERESLIKHTENFCFEDYKILLEQIDSISKYEKDFNSYYTINVSIANVFTNLAKVDFELFMKVFQLLFRHEYSKHIYVGIIFKEIEYNEYRTQEIRRLIIQNKIPTGCIVPFLSHLPIDFIEKEDYNIFMNFFQDEKTVYINFIEDIFVKFKNLCIDFEKELHHILDYLMAKSNDANFYISKDFFQYLHEYYNQLFLNRIKDIQIIYLLLDSKNRHFDYELSVLKLILEINPNFINYLLEFNFDKKTFISKTDLLENDFKRLWDLENRNIVFEYIITFLSEIPSFFRNVRSEASTIFQQSGQNGLDFLFYLVNKTKNETILRLTFNIILSEFKDLKYDFLDIILKKNSKIEFFRSLDFYAGEGVTTGSRIPKIRYEITIYEELKDYMQRLNNINFLEHINFLENEITNCKTEIEWERKREFLSEWSI